MKITARRPATGRKGAVALEFALILPIFMMLMLGIIECGQVMSSEELITNATREGARLAGLGGSTMGTGSSTGANEVNYRIRSYLSSGGIAPSTATITITDLDATITDLPQASAGDRIKVTVAVPFKSIAWSKSA